MKEFIITKKQIFMKNFTLLFLIFSIFTCEKASPQIITRSIDDLETMLKFSKGQSFERQKSYSTIKGTPYLSDDFTQGEIYTKDSILYKALLRFNIYEDEIEFKSDSVIRWIAEPQDIVYVKIDKSVFIYIHPDKKRNKKGFYYELLEGGKCKLLLRRNAEFLPAEPAKPYIDAKPARFSMINSTYFLQIDNGLPQSITNRKSIENAFPEKSSVITRYIKKEKISIKEKEDLIKLVKYYNSM